MKANLCIFVFMTVYVVCWWSFCGCAYLLRNVVWHPYPALSIIFTLIMQLRSREPLQFQPLPLFTVVMRPCTEKVGNYKGDWSKLRRYRIPFSQVTLCCILLLRYFCSRSYFCIINNRLLEPSSYVKWRDSKQNVVSKDHLHSMVRHSFEISSSVTVLDCSFEFWMTLTIAL